MIFEFDNYKLDIDVEKTRAFYEEKSTTVAESCSCDGCQNFDQAVDYLPLEVKEFFTGLGVDIRKVCDCNAVYQNQDGSLFYDGACDICGDILSGGNSWNEPANNFEISKDFHVAFTKYGNFREREIPHPAIELIFFANIPWVLDKENIYEKLSD